MAPGGRRWSESPIPRVGKQRVRRMGVIPGMMPVYIDHDWVPSSTTPGTDVLDTSTLAALADDGNLFIVWCVGAGVGAFTAPAGWTVDASGTFGLDSSYLVAHTTKSGTTDWDFAFADAIDADTWRAAAATVWEFEGTDGPQPSTTLVVDAATATASTAQALPAAPAGTFMPPWGASPDFWASGTSPQWNAYLAVARDGATTGASNYDTIPGSGSMTAENHGGVLIGRVNGFLGGCISGTPTVDTSSDWLTLAFGFTTVGYP